MKYFKILSEDDKATDARVYFEAALKVETGFDLAAFKEEAKKESPEDGYTIHHYLGKYRLTISADHQFYELYVDENPDQTRQDFIEMLTACGLMVDDSTPDFDKIAAITGHTRSSLRSMLAPGKNLPRWVKLSLHVWDIQKVFR